MWGGPFDMKPDKSNITSKQICGGLYYKKSFIRM